jgi:hypothetical protein
MIRSAPSGRTFHARFPSKNRHRTGDLPLALPPSRRDRSTTPIRPGPPRPAR